MVKFGWLGSAAQVDEINDDVIFPYTDVKGPTGLNFLLRMTERPVKSRNYQHYQHSEYQCVAVTATVLPAMMGC
jgi:hypothetical protein